MTTERNGLRRKKGDRKANDRDFTLGESVPDCPELLVPRLGECLVEEGIIGLSELRQALEQQAARASTGESVLLGQLLVEIGLVSRSELDKVVARQIFELQEALEASNRGLDRRVRSRTAELQNALERLTKLNRLKAEFVANVSHELRMPMQFLTGYLDLLSSESLGPLTTEQNRAVTRLTDANQRLRNVIEDLLHFSESTSSNLPVDISPTSLPVTLHPLIRDTRPKAASRDIDLKTELLEDIPPVQADGERIKWVVGQLLDNAVKFTQPGGRVDVRTDPNEEDVIVSVSDTGIGIPRDHLAEIFIPFHQLDGSARRHVGGMGLGLALAQSILEAHGSSMTVHSEVGRGSCFSFSLPYWSSS